MKLREGYSAAFCTVKHIRTRIVLLAQPKSTRLALNATQLTRGWLLFCLRSVSVSFDVAVVFISLNIADIADIAVCNDPFCTAINHQKSIIIVINQCIGSGGRDRTYDQLINSQSI